MILTIVAFVLILANCIVSYKGFTDRAFFKRNAFGVDKLLIEKKYHLLITSGFLHVGWLHLILNMVTLYMFTQTLEYYLSAWQYLVIYFASLIGGDLFSLFVHRNHGDYTSVGASGAVSGIIFAGIALIPGLEMGFFFVPISLPAWVFGLAYILYSIYGVRSRSDNVGHESHLAGALVGMIAAVAMFPQALAENYVTILLIFVPSAIFIYIIMSKPASLLVDNRFFRKHDFHTIDDKYNLAKKDKQQEIDRILEKIHRRGMGSLTQKEKDFLNNAR